MKQWQPSLRFHLAIPLEELKKNTNIVTESNLYVGRFEEGPSQIQLIIVINFTNMLGSMAIKLKLSLQEAVEAYRVMRYR
jgi:hypothetical protein